MRILFVCLGNICRSPTAEAVFRQRVQQAGLSAHVSIDSAGTGDWHIGKAPDRRACQAAKARGYDLSSLRARQVTRADFQQFDLILAMDKSNLADLQRLNAEAGKAEVDLYLRRYGLPQEEVPDPYYGDGQGFALVLDLLEQASQALLNEVRRRW